MLLGNPAPKNITCPNLGHVFVWGLGDTPPTRRFGRPNLVLAKTAPQYATLSFPLRQVWTFSMTFFRLGRHKRYFGGLLCCCRSLCVPIPVAFSCCRRKTSLNPLSVRQQVWEFNGRFFLRWLLRVRCGYDPPLPFRFVGIKTASQLGT